MSVSGNVRNAKSYTQRLIIKRKEIFHEMTILCQKQ